LFDVAGLSIAVPFVTDVPTTFSQEYPHYCGNRTASAEQQLSEGSGIGLSRKTIDDAAGEQPSRRRKRKKQVARGKIGPVAAARNGERSRTIAGRNEQNGEKLKKARFAEPENFAEVRAGERSRTRMVELIARPRKPTKTTPPRITP